MSLRDKVSPWAQGIRKMRDDPDYLDVVVTVADSDFPCHKLVLAATSDFFRGLFRSGMKETLDKKVELKEISAETFELVLRWIYYHEEILTETNMYDVTLAANQLQTQALISEGKQFLTENISTTNCARILYYSKLLEWDTLGQSAWKYLLENFDKVCKSELNSLSSEDFKNLVSSTDLVALSEDSVMQSVLDWVDADQDSKSPSKEQRVECLAELMKSCRYSLVSSHFVWQVLEKNSHVQEDPRCREMVREILRYKTQLDLHQQWCPQSAIHRRTAKQRNHLFVVDKTSIDFIFLESDPAPSNLLSFNFDYLKRNTKITGTAYHNGTLYIETRNTVENRKFLYCLGPNSYKFSCCNEDASKRDRTVAFLSVDHSLIAVRSSYNGHCIERMDLPCTMSSKWSKTGFPATEGAKLAHATVIGSKLLMFWKRSDCINMEWFDLDQRSSHISSVTFDQVSSVATFRTGDNLFVLQGDGVLWRTLSLSEAPHIGLIQEKRLWTGKSPLLGAIVVNDRLYVMEDDSLGENESVSCKRSIDGVFREIQFYYMKEDLIYCIHAVISGQD